MIGYYDYVLGLIPATLLGITALLFLVGVPASTAASLGGVPAALLIGHALFVNAPSSPRPGADAELPDASPQGGVTAD